MLPDAVVRADLRRSRQAVSGIEVDPQAALFATRLARAVVDVPRPEVEQATDPGSVRLFGWRAGHERQDVQERVGRAAPPMLPALRDAVFGDGMFGDPALLDGPDAVRLPTAPA